MEFINLIIILIILAVVVLLLKAVILVFSTLYEFLFLSFFIKSIRSAEKQEALRKNKYDVLISNGYVDCPRCRGRGMYWQNDSWERCHYCAGTGAVHPEEVPEIKARVNRDFAISNRIILIILLVVIIVFFLVFVLGKI